MASIRACDGCGKPVADLDEGRKVVCGCDYGPPSVLMDYCPACTVPAVLELAKLNPNQLIQSVEVLMEGEWVPLWEGEILFDPEQTVFTNGYETIIPDNELPSASF